MRLVYSLRINATSNPVEGGSVSGGGTYAEGASCTLTATANPGYIFANWTENGEVVSSEASYSFIVTSNRNLVANFLYAISVVVMPENGGTVSGIGMDETDSLVVNYNFNNGLQGWTTIDADGDGNDWYCWNAYVMSHSWRNNVALHPDNYLVSPVVILGGSITFKARAGDNNYAAEHFGVAVSTTGTDASDFTIVEEWTMSAKAVGNWYEYTVDLSSFSGMGYVAIRHFNCSDMFTLQVDDVVITAPSSLTFYTGGYAEGQTCTLTAVPNTGWEFNNWTENGVEVSTEPTYSFTVDGGRNIVASFEQTYSTQPINLSQGTNWFSTNLDITLDDLKAALVAASPGTTITIKSQNSGQTTWNGRLWVGTLRTMDVSQMYMISVANACEITLEGMPINPAEHPVTISNGPNWIGFPLGESMTITNAFASFATIGDIIKSNGSGQATWNGHLWVGQLKNLESGKGYIYNSAATESRIFNFPTSSK